MFDIDKLTRENIRRLKPYRSARDEYKGEAQVWLDANENPFESGLNRYPDPMQRALKEKISAIKKVDPQNIFLGNGSDEAIDLLMRAFCVPGRDRIMLFPPTYGMYTVSAAINDVALAEVPLDDSFQISLEKVVPLLADERLKMVFICSPNNPTGNLIPAEQIRTLAQNFHGLVVVDEAYIDFARTGGMLPHLKEIPNMVVLQTFSKAWGMAGIRLGMAFAGQAVIAVLNKIKPPYNVNGLTQKAALTKLDRLSGKAEEIRSMIRERDRLQRELQKLPPVLRVFPSDANFLLVRFTDAGRIYRQLAQKGVVVRDRSKVVPGCLRISVGTEKENQRLLDELKALD